MRELRSGSNIVFDAARMGRNELLHFVQETMNGSWVKGTGQSRSSYSPGDPLPYKNYTAPHTAADWEKTFRQRQAEQKEAARAKAAAPAAGAKSGKIRYVKNGRLGMLIGGAVLTGMSFLNWMNVIIRASYGISTVGAVVAAVVMGLPGLALLGSAAAKDRKEKRYARYLTVAGKEGVVSLSHLAQVANVSLKKVQRDIEDMVDRGYFGKSAYVNAGRGLLVIDPAAAESAAEEAARREAEEAAREATRTPDAYESLLQQLRTLNDRIADEAMSQKIYRIESVTRATFLAVKEKPEKEPQIRRFMDYYLPTTIKLLDAYAGFEKQDVVGENIRKSRENIESMMETLANAFEKQFDSLFLTETMDINADIRTMDSLLRQDGYVGGIQMPKEQQGGTT